VHGNADDNVHYQQSMILSRALEQNDVMFQQLSYPDENHGINGAGMRRHLYHSLEKFLFSDCFQPTEDDSPPSPTEDGSDTRPTENGEDGPTTTEDASGNTTQGASTNFISAFTLIALSILSLSINSN